MNINFLNNNILNLNRQLILSMLQKCIMSSLKQLHRTEQTKKKKKILIEKIQYKLLRFKLKILSDNSNYIHIFCVCKKL